MKQNQVNKKLLIEFLVPFLENEIESEEWELMEVTTNYYDLLKGYAMEDVVMQHLPSETFWKSKVMYVPIDGYIDNTNNKLEWEQVFPTDVTEVKTEYHGKESIGEVAG